MQVSVPCFAVVSVAGRGGLVGDADNHMVAFSFASPRARTFLLPSFRLAVKYPLQLILSLFSPLDVNVALNMLAFDYSSLAEHAK